jgi:predicted TIM-barrel fold metal-dependent hydrolase
MSEDGNVRSLRIDHEYDTREHLLNATRQAHQRGYGDFMIVDVDAHHFESESWSEICTYIEDPVLRQESGGGRAGSLIGGLPLMGAYLGNQDISGRVLRHPMRRHEQSDPDQERTVTLALRAMDAIGIDYQIIFPTPMLSLGLNPRLDVEVALARAYARWLTERVISASDRLKTMLYLPFNDPEASLAMVEEFGETPGVVGFMVTSARHRPVHDNAYVPLYRALEERGLPLGFHAGYTWQGVRATELFNRFISVHAIGFPFYNMIHLTNWLVNGLPERFPALRVLWIESGLAWLPFMMQRLDMEFTMRSAEAPLLQRMPSEYMRDMYFSSQPMEIPRDLSILEGTFRMINAEQRLVYSSDYPHWDFDLPSVIYDLPFLTSAAKHRILGGNARELFGLPEVLRKNLDGVGAPELQAPASHN